MTDVLKTLRTTSGQLTAALVWKEKDPWAEKERISDEEWQKMKDEERAAIRSIVEFNIEVLLDRIDEWLPRSMTLDSQGQFVDITFRLIFSDIKSEMEAEQELTTRRIQRAAKETIDMVREAHENPDPEPRTVAS